MNPLLVNTNDRGGAANACIRLHKGLLEKGVSSKLLVKNITRSDVPEVYKISIKTIERSFKTKVRERVIRALKSLNFDIKKPDTFIASRLPGLEMFSYPYSDYRITKSNLYQQADIINLHWVAEFLDYKSFFKECDKPVVWTLHDQNPFSGGEHVPEKYYGIDKNGYPLKRVITAKEKQTFLKLVEVKYNALIDVKKLHIVALNNWMKNEVKNSRVFNRFEVSIIPNGIDKEVFAPRDIFYSRELLNIPKNKKIVLFVTDTFSRYLKGFIYLKKAIEQLNRDDVYLITVGAKNKNLFVNNKIKEFDFIYDELLMSIIYSAADVFVIPSLMDNLPNTVIESLMCGTPVIGFPVGGIPDMIQHGKNGLLCDEISVSSLVKTINNFLDNMHLFDVNKIRIDAVKQYDLSVQAKKYIDLYNKILRK